MFQIPGANFSTNKAKADLKECSSFCIKTQGALAIVRKGIFIESRKKWGRSSFRRRGTVERDGPTSTTIKYQKKKKQGVLLPEKKKATRGGGERDAGNEHRGRRSRRPISKQRGREFLSKRKKSQEEERMDALRRGDNHGGTPTNLRKTTTRRGSVRHACRRNKNHEAKGRALRVRRKAAQVGRSHGNGVKKKEGARFRKKKKESRRTEKRGMCPIHPGGSRLGSCKRGSAKGGTRPCASSEQIRKKREGEGEMYVFLRENASSFHTRREHAFPKFAFLGKKDWDLKKERKRES